MPLPSDRVLNNYSPTQSFSLKQKGLGWIPDVPEQRDYSFIDSDIDLRRKIKSDKNLTILDDARNSLILSIEQALSDLSEDNSVKEFAGNIIDKLKDNFSDKEFFGGVIFKEFKSYKILKKGSSDINLPNLKWQLSLLGYREAYYIRIGESDISVPFSKYAGFATQDNIDKNDEEKSKKHIKWFTEWVSGTSFDEATEVLVRSFQLANEIRVDGVVGVQTHLKLHDALHGLTAQNKPLELVPILPSVPDLFLWSLLNTVKNVAIQFMAEGENNNIGEIQKLISEILGNQSFPNFRRSLESLSLCNFYKGKIEVLQFSLEAFQSEYTIFESIFALLMKVFSPLQLYQQASKDRLSDLVALVLKNWVEGNDLGQILNADPSSFAGLKNFTDDKVKNLVLFASQATDKLTEQLKVRIELLAGEFDPDERLLVEELEEEQIKELGPSLCLLFLLLALFQKIMGKRGEVPLNSIAKKELFVVFDDVLESSKGTEKTLLSIEPNVIIPVSKSYSKSSSSNLQYSFLPYAVDLSYWCSAVEDQGKLKSCSAFAGIALLEYFAQRTQGAYRDASPLFLYKVARNLMQSTEDVGASLRDTLKAMEKFGVPPAEYWPYIPEKVNEEPSQFCYNLASNYKAFNYFRLDHAGISGENLLYQAKAVLAAGFPCAFGFTVYLSAGEEDNVREGWIPFPRPQERFVGGHAVVAVGYNDFEIVGVEDEANPPGAFLIRNSWGKEWGINGYGWLPYSYVLKGLTADWWSLLEASWFEKDLVGLGASPYSPGDGGPPTN